MAIPFLKEHNITYYNPQQPNWVPEMIELEHQAKQTSKVSLTKLSWVVQQVPIRDFIHHNQILSTIVIRFHPP